LAHYFAGPTMVVLFWVSSHTQVRELAHVEMVSAFAMVGIGRAN
jgi:hypothetical protein